MTTPTRKATIAKIPYDMREKLLRMINQYFACQNVQYQSVIVIDIMFFIMRFWQRGYITATECCELLKDLD